MILRELNLVIASRRRSNPERERRIWIAFDGRRMAVVFEVS